MIRYNFIERILYASEASDRTGGRTISNIDVPSMSHGLVRQVLMIVSSQVESDSCVQDTGISGKSVYFCSRRSFNVRRLKDLSALLALPIFEIAFTIPCIATTVTSLVFV